MNIKIGKGEPKHISGLLDLINELAIYEKAEHEVEVTEAELMNDCFGENKAFDFFVALDGDEVIGIALYYFKYSTWKGKCIHLEDLVVSTEYRRKGIGKLLFDALMNLSREQKVKRMEWQVLEWNEPAIEFYKQYETNFDGKWINCKLTYEQLQAK